VKTTLLPGLLVMLVGGIKTSAGAMTPRRAAALKAAPPGLLTMQS